jgi:hypothetical protein
MVGREREEGGWMAVGLKVQDQPLDWHGVPPTGGRNCPSRGESWGKNVDNSKSSYRQEEKEENIEG